MSTPSNLYAEKVFSEHPIALWALDDRVDFLSLANFSDKSFLVDQSYWSISGGTVNNDATISYPIQESPIIRLATESESTSLQLTSRILFNGSSLDPTKETFNISTYFRADTDAITSVSIGYTDGQSTYLEPYQISSENGQTFSWLLLSKTFDVPQNKDVRAVIVVTYDKIGEESDYSLYLNGFSLGQWSEEYITYSTGVEAVDFPSSIPLDINKAIPADAYGLQESNGYYIVDDKRLCAVNNGVPMVFGAPSVTKIYPNGGLPSLIVPGFGFLNDSGKDKDYTLEFWARIDNRSRTPRRIVGPISSSDGLYVDESFLTLSIGNQTASHSVREWNRPMLIQIRYVGNSTSLLINGESVLSVDTENAVFPNRLTGTKENDWIGFYAYDDVPIVELDCVGIYSYSVPDVVAKRRFVYGQGVDFPENLNTGDNGRSVYIDYKFSDYSKSFVYPDTNPWRQGAAENLTIQNNSLATIEYKLPELFIDYNRSKITDALYAATEIIFTSNNSFSVGERISVSGADQEYLNVSGAMVTAATSDTFTISKPSDFPLSPEKISGNLVTARSSVKKRTDQLLIDNSKIQNEQSNFLSLRPNNTWRNTGSYLLFENLNVADQGISAVYGVFKSEENLAKQTLIKLEDTASKNYLEISLIDNDIIRYSIKYGEEAERVLFEQEGYVSGEIFQAGLDMAKASNRLGGDVRSLLGSKDSLGVYVGGSQNLSNTFSGNIYSVGFATTRNLRKISRFFDENGIAINSFTAFDSYFQSEGQSIGLTSIEASLGTPDYTYNQGDTTFGSGESQAIFAIDVEPFTATTEGILFEQGATVMGMAAYLVGDGTLRITAGDGSAWANANASWAEIDITSIVGQAGTFYFYAALNTDSNNFQAWWVEDGPESGNTPMLLGQGYEFTANNTFIFGGNEGGVGVANNNPQLGISPVSYQGTINQERIWLNQTLPVAFPAQIPFDYSGGSSSTTGSDTLSGGQSATFEIPSLYGHTATYTLVPTIYYGNFILNIATEGYWEDYVPLNYFGKFVNEDSNSRVFGLDYLQLNIDYPSIPAFIGDAYDTNLSEVRTYVSFKYIADRANTDLDFLEYYEPVPKSNVVVPASNWWNTKYEVLNNTVIYPPENIDFTKVKMIIHIEVRSANSSRKQIKINSLHIGANATNNNSLTEIGTRFGFPLFPVTKNGIYSNYRTRNPLLISKNSAPYLHLTESSGIGLLDYPENTGYRSLRVGVNRTNQPLFRLGAIQKAFKYYRYEFPAEPEKIFEIKSINKNIEFFIAASNSSKTRGKIYAIDSDSKLPYSNVNLYLNGNLVKELYVETNTWSLIGMQFPTSLVFDSDTTAELAVSGGAFINNLLFYPISAVQNSSTTIYRSWGQVVQMLDKDDDTLTPDVDESQTFWQDFLEDEVYGEIEGPVSWGTVLLIPTESQPFIDPAQLYSTYLGTNKEIVGDEVKTTFGNYKYTFYSDVKWSSSINTPV